MISDKEFLEIIQGLYEKTAKENLAWQKTMAGYTTGNWGEDAYWIRLPHSDRKSVV